MKRIDFASINGAYAGFLTKREGKFLYDAGRKVSGKGCILEIGSWLGKSTVCLAMGSKHGPKVNVYAVDPHKGTIIHKEFGIVSSLEIFLNNIEKFGVEDIVVPIVKTSEEASIGWNKPIELIFIDGCHDYKAVLFDLLTWFKYLTQGGTIAFHDTSTHEGPRKVVEKYVYSCSSFKKIGKVDTITYAKKCSELPDFDVIIRKINRSVRFALLKTVPVKIKNQ